MLNKKHNFDFKYFEWFSGIKLNGSSIIVEIGAFNGTLSKYLSDKYKIKKAFAVESSLTNYDILSTSIKNYKNIIPINVAVGNTDGDVSFYEFDNNPNSNSIVKGISKYERSSIEYRTSMIKSVRLKSLICNLKILNIDLLLLNCEGAEKYILNDIVDENLYSIINNISVEFHPHLYGQKTSIDLIQKLLKFYDFNITKKSIRGPINVIFYKNGINNNKRKFLVLRLLKVKTIIMDAIWPVLSFLNKMVKGKIH